MGDLCPRRTVHPGAGEAVSPSPATWVSREAFSPAKHGILTPDNLSVARGFKRRLQRMALEPERVQKKSLCQPESRTCVSPSPPSNVAGMEASLRTAWMGKKLSPRQ